MLWLLSFHIIFVITLFAAIFYLPRLFVYHAMSTDSISQERFKIMERKLFFGIMLPSAILVLLSGIGLLIGYAWDAYKTAGWLHIKLLLVALLYIYIFMCWKIMLNFKNNRNKLSHVFFRWFNEVPVLLLIAIVILVTVKPF
jgi:putative membrane protein